MSTAPTLVSTSAAVSAPTGRIASIDVFRGLTMMVMIFVNDLSECARPSMVDLPRPHAVKCDDLCGHGVSFLPVHRGHVDAHRNRGKTEARPILCCSLAAHSFAFHRSDCFGTNPRECREGRSCSHGTTDSRLGAARINGRHSLLAGSKSQHPARSHFSWPADRGLSDDRRSVCNLSANNARHSRRGLISPTLKFLV